MKRKVVVSIITVALAGGTLLGASRVFAQDVPGQTSSLVQKIADTFHLNKNDVQAVFDQNRKDRQAQMEARFETRLEQDVKNGKITEAQKQLIINKRKELEANQQSLLSQVKGKTPQERRTILQQQRQDLENWAKQNNIDPRYLFGGMDMRSLHWRFKINPATSVTPTPTPI